MSDLRIRGDASLSRTMRVLPSRFMQRLRQKFGVNDESVNLELADKVSIVVPADPDRPEESFLFGERIIGDAFSLDAGGATNDNQVAVWLPNDTQDMGTIAIIDKITLASPTIASLDVTTANILEALAAPALTSTPFRWRDTRGPQLGPFVGSTDIIGALVNGVRLRGGFRVTAGATPIAGALQKVLSTGEHNVGIVLLPGWGIVIQNRTPDTILDVSFEARERAIDKSERFLNRNY